MNRVERLLRQGLLPSQLPPCFTTDTLASNHAVLSAAWLSLEPGKPGISPKAPSGKSEVFSVARAGHQRRSTSISNPVAQTFLSQAIVNNWAAIVHHFRKSRISASHPRFRRDANRAASLPSMQNLFERRLLIGAGYRYVLRTDISRFFPTIYTHSIPWALHGKSVAKKNRKLTPKYFGNLLDTAVRQCQDEQTFGLPIGPDTSHIIAECIATAVDIDLAKRLRTNLVGFRYVDDYYLFFETQSAAEGALAHLVRCLKEFELQINFEKTKICRTEELEEDSWTHTLRSIDIANDGQRQRSDANHFFEIARSLARAHSDESVMVYALRRVSSVIVRVDNWAPFEAQLCLVAAALYLRRPWLPPRQSSPFPTHELASFRACAVGPSQRSRMVPMDVQRTKSHRTCAQRRPCCRDELFRLRPASSRHVGQRIATESAASSALQSPRAPRVVVGRILDAEL